LSRLLEVRRSIISLEEVSKGRVKSVCSKFFYFVDSISDSLYSDCKMTSKSWDLFNITVSDFERDIVSIFKASLLASVKLGNKFSGFKSEEELNPEFSLFGSSVLKDAVSNILAFKSDIISDVSSKCSTVSLASTSGKQYLGKALVRILQARLVSRLLAGISVLVHRGSSEAQIFNISSKYTSSGLVVVKKWNARKTACVHCRALDGVEVEVSEEFPRGDIPVYMDLKACPRHPFCACVLSFRVKSV
jgi:hypothetical protein